MPITGARHSEQVRQRKWTAELPRVPANLAPEDKRGGPGDQLQGVLQGLQQGTTQPPLRNYKESVSGDFSLRIVLL